MFYRSRNFRILSVCLSVALAVSYLLLFAGLPSNEEIRNFRPETTVVQDAVNWDKPKEQPIRIWVPIKRISPWLQKAVVVSEDDQFYQHSGVNFAAMKEALRINWQKRRYVRGASTITMQLARNAFLHKRKTLLRKIREIILARRMEKQLSKESILEAYLNIVEWGENIFGAEAAARHYFGKSAANLDLSEASLLAAMLPNPKYFDPFKRAKSCKRMQKRVIRLMKIARQITAPQAEEVLTASITLRGFTQARQTAAIDSLEEAKYMLPMPEEPKPALKLQARSMTDTAVYDTLAVQDSNKAAPPNGFVMDSVRTKIRKQP